VRSMAMLRAESLAAKLWERPTKEDDDTGAKASAEATRAATRAKTVFIFLVGYNTGGEENELARRRGQRASSSLWPSYGYFCTYM
jgi:hypothetical protein